MLRPGCFFLGQGRPSSPTLGTVAVGLVLLLRTCLARHPCGPGEFKCAGGQLCLPNDKRCDFVRDCPQGEDEDKALCHFMCLPGKFLCDDGTCIDVRGRCDGHADCPEREPADERDCPCRPESEWQCDLGKCIPKSARCDGHRDCPADESDERDCRCRPESEWTCERGQCIPISARCNGRRDCPEDDSDEQGCPECSATQFRCSDGTCISGFLRCNDLVDCADASDERNCPCRPGQFMCQNGFCIDSKRKCDSYYDCQDRSDEMNCSATCAGNEFRCSDGTCIRENFKCNRLPDCRDGSDEKDCPPVTCRPDDFRCNDGLCLNIARRCDNIRDCARGEDEEQCKCPHGHFACNDGSCIDERRICDGRIDCRDRSDEQDCPECGPGEFRCDDGSCIDARLQCDNRFDCRDHSDEDCDVRCGTGQFKCDDDTCIEASNRCNEYPHCPDRSDERGCVTCAPGYISCNDETCIDARRRCDGRSDCRDSSDEQGCEKCPHSQFACNDGSCIDERRKCDGRIDCRDRSDEQNCPEKPVCSPEDIVCGDGSCVPRINACDGRFDCIDETDERDCEECSHTEFRCKDSTCIDIRRKCDRHPDCPDRSDELNCEVECPHGQFACNDGSCIDDSRKCDGRIDCRDRSDEHNCPECPHGQFACNDGSCIDERRKCDGRNDCRDRSDEHNCPECPHGQFSCNDGSCIDETRKCDGRIDCRDTSDEHNCPAHCGPHQFICDDGACVAQETRCDNFYDCNDYSDEQNCEVECLPHQLRCLTGQCIDMTRKCDGLSDCRDQSDESDCVCETGKFTCNNGECLDISARCDGKLDCADNSDEADCHWRTCSTTEFRCENGPCIPVSHRCNGQYDCPDTSDELDCPSRGNVNLKTYPTQQTIHQSREVVFQCRDEGSQRAPVHWTRERNLPLPPGTSDQYGRLTMPNIQLEHSGTYFCSAIGFPPTQPGAQQSVYLTVQRYDPPTPPSTGRPCTEEEATCQNGMCIRKEFVCDGDVDCTDNTDELSCSKNVSCHPNEYRCNNGKCILKLWLCDGDNDCLDKSDEIACATNPPGSVCRYDEYRCLSGNQCIPKSFQCDGEIDCQDRSDEIGCAPPTIVQLPPETKEVNLGETVTLSCRAIGNPTPLINWRLNWNHIPPPPRVIVTNMNGRGELVIHKVQLSDQGAYTCEAINNKDSVLGRPDTELIIRSTPSICQPPMFNTAARTRSECVRCFCFGATDQCTSSSLFVTQVPPITNIAVVAVTIGRDGSYTLQDPNYSLDQDYVDFRSNNREFHLDGRVRQGDPRNVLIYWSLPSQYLGDKLKSYGGYLRYSVLYRISTAPTPASGAEIIIKGSGATIAYTQTDPFRAGAVNSVEARLWEGQWVRLAGPTRGVWDQRPSASREDIMMVLQNVEAFMIRASYDENFVESSLYGLSLDTAVAPESGQQRAIYIEQCTCPEGYTGLSCESCASGYTRLSTGRYLGECRRSVCNCHGHSDRCSPQGICESCQHDTEGPQCERCRAGFYGNARRGTPADCQPCPCPLTLPSNQFSATCFLDQDGQVTCDACPSHYEGRRCDRCAPGYQGNPLLPGDSCHQVRDQCDAIGSTSLAPNPVTGLCQCKPSVTGARCTQCRDSHYHLNPHSSNGCIHCFCMGVTRSCNSCTWYRSKESAQFTDNTQGFALTTIEESQVIDRGLLVNPSRELTYREFSFLPRGRTYYWRLPSRFIGNKVTAYGGYLNYTVRFVSTPGSAPNMEADVQLVGNRITLDYFHERRLLPNTSNTISVLMFENNWRRSDGQTSTREHLLMALADMTSLLIKATYTSDTTKSSLSEVSLEIAVEHDTGGPRALEVEQCNCPIGYKGLSCEDCAVGYTRSGGGLYLGLCTRCFCNGHSSDCDPESGVCRNCQHNTEGTFCESCKPGFVGDATKGTPNDCSPGPEEVCRCSVQGSLGLECDRRKQCPCKNNVEGLNCNRCKEGNFNLEARNPEGCTPCFCFGITERCSSSVLYRDQVELHIADAWSHGVTLTNKERDRTITDGFSANPGRKEISFRSFPPPSPDVETLYWSLPQSFLGNKLTSYGGRLHFMQRYLSRSTGESYDETDVILVGNGITMVFVSRPPLQPDEGRDSEVELTETYWQQSENHGLLPATRENFLMVLAHLEAILIRASFNTRMIDSVLGGVSMEIAVPRSTGRDLAPSVEQCSCPPGYTGTSCEECAAGYIREKSAGPFLGRCTVCNCHGHSESCDVNSGLCLNCEHNTAGLSCDRCAPGFFGDATRGTPNDCKACACPLTTSTNQFSKTCRLDTDGRPTCTACPTGYAGRNCENCAPGYRGNPRQVGDSCRPEVSSTEQPFRGIQVLPHFIQSKEGDTAAFNCNVYSYGHFVVHWRRLNGRPLPKGAIRIPTSRGSQLILPKVLLDDESWYECHVTSMHFHATATAALRVHGGSSITVRIEEPKVVRTESGATVNFRCSGISQVSYNIIWTREGAPLPSNAQELEGILTIRNVQPENSGTYICTGSDLHSVTEDRATLLVTESTTKLMRPRVWIEPRYLQVQVGDPVEFRCVAEGSPAPSLQWTGGQNNQLSPQSTFRDGIFRISSARKSDEAEYQCTATNELGTETVQTIIYVQGDDRHQPHSDGEVQVTVVPQSQSARPGETVRFECRPGSHVIAPRISWSRSGATLPQTASQVGGSLTLSNVDSSFTGIYICTVTSSVGSTQSQARLDVISAGGRPTAEIEPAQQMVSQGASVELRCLVSGIPQPTVQWAKAGEELGSNAQIVDRTTLRITNANIRDRGRYICSATNSEGSARAFAILEVERRELPALEVYPGTTVSIVRGGSAVFQCRVTAGVPSPKASWARADGRPLGRSAEVSGEGTVIRFNRVVGDEAGQYTCTAENSAGVVTASASLVIQGLPQVTISPASPYTVALGQRVHIECRAEGDPTPSVSWNQPRPPDGVRVALPRETPGISILEISEAKPEDSGIYICTARNPAGVSEERLQLTVDSSHLTNVGIETDRRDFVVPEGSRAELTCYATTSDTNGLTIKWIRSDNRPLPIGHIARDGLLVIEKVRKEDAGDYSCLAIENEIVVFTVQQRVHVVAPPRVKLVPARQTVRPGGTAYIQCQAEGDQPINIEWTRVGSRLGPEAFASAGTLQFRSISISDAGRYLCMAQNAAGRAEGVAELLVNDMKCDDSQVSCADGSCADPGSQCGQQSHDCFASDLPCTEEPIINMPNRDLNVFIGATIDLPCEVRATPKPSVMWSKEIGDLPFNSRIVDNNLRISSVRMEDAGRYFCTATNDAGSSRDYLVLNVKGLSPMTVRIEPSLDVVRMGDSLDVKCEVTGDSTAFASWSRVGGPLPYNAQTAGNLLRITNVQPENGGVYRCRVDAFTGPYTDDYVLSIQDIPSLPQNSEVETRTAPFASTVVMDCVTNLSPPIKFVWSKQGGLLPADTSVRGSILTIPDVRAEDAGTYVCTAHNAESSINIPTILVVTGVVPYFAQAPVSYMALATLPDAYLRFDMEVSFKPESPDGLILYNGQQAGGSGDFISFGLNQGYAEFRFDVGSGPAVLRSATPLSIGEWHTVLMSRDKKEGMMIVNSHMPVNGTAGGRFQGLDLIEPLYVGGVPDFTAIHKQSGFSRGFVGCISRLVLGSVVHQLVRDAQITSGVTTCETCAVNPCRNGGVCQEAHTDTGHICICPPGFSGVECEKVGEACYPGVCGTGRCINKPDGGYDCYCPFGKAGLRCERDITIFEPAFRDEAFVAYKMPNTQAQRHLKLLTRVKPRDLKDGILLYSGQNEKGQGDFISLTIKDRRVEFRFDTGSGPAVLQSKEELQADQWVQIRAERSMREGTLVVNDGEEVRGKSPGYTRGLNLRLDLYVGGVDRHRIVVSPMVEVSSSFDGCISQVEISDVSIDLINAVVDAANVDDCGGQTPCDRQPCLNGGLCRELGPHPTSYECICQKGFVGLNCEIEEDLCQVIHPCENGGTCVGTVTAYRCNCPLNYGGVNCEQPVEFTENVRFEGDGYLELPRDLLPHSTSTVNEIISLTFDTYEANGILFWQGQTPEKDGKGQDFVGLAVVDGYLEFSYELGSGPAQIRSPIRVDDGNTHKVVIKRLGRDGSLVIDTVFTEYGESQGVLQMLNVEGNIYLGGLPNSELMTAGRYKNSFVGCIQELEIQDSGILDLQHSALSGINAVGCDGDEVVSSEDMDNQIHK